MGRPGFGLDWNGGDVELGGSGWIGFHNLQYLIDFLVGYMAYGPNTLTVCIFHSRFIFVSIHAVSTHEGLHNDSDLTNVESWCNQL